MDFWDRVQREYQATLDRAGISRVAAQLERLRQDMECSSVAVQLGRLQREMRLPWLDAIREAEDVTTRMQREADAAVPKVRQFSTPDVEVPSLRDLAPASPVPSPSWLVDVEENAFEIERLKARVAALKTALHPPIENEKPDDAPDDPTLSTGQYV
jgi:hypothetical protein